MKKYTLFSLLLIIFSGFFVYINSNSSTTMTFMGINLTMYNAVWVMFFMSILFINSIIFSFVLKYKNYKFEKNIKKDINVIKDNIKNRVLEIDKFNNTIILNNLNSFISSINGLRIIPKKIEEFEFLEIISKIQNGEVVDLKKEKLPKNSEWVVLNELNRLKTNPELAIKMVKSEDEFIKSKATEIVLNSGNVDNILKLELPITKKLILDNLESKNLKTLLEKSNLEEGEYLEIAQKLYKESTNPEALFELFEKHSFAYVYLLIEYGVIDKAVEVAKERELKLFEYYLFMREKGLKVGIKEFLDARFF